MSVETIVRFNALLNSIDAVLTIFGVTVLLIMYRIMRKDLEMSRQFLELTRAHSRHGERNTAEALRAAERIERTVIETAKTAALISDHHHLPTDQVK